MRGMWILGAIVVSCSAACRQLDFDRLEQHVLAIDNNGRIAEVRTGKGLDGEEVRALIHDLFGRARVESTRRADRERGPTARELLIHIHGGLNAAQDSLGSAQDALERMDHDPAAPHTIFITWPSGAWSTYWDHLLYLRQGQRWSQVWGFLSAPLIFCSDLASSLGAAPETLLYQALVDIRVASKVAFGWSLDRATADEEALWRVAEAAGYHIKRGCYSRGFLTQASRFLSYWLTQPPKVVFQILFLNGMGQGAWEVMLHRTRSMFHGPDEYAMSSERRADPRELREHVEDQKARLHAFFEVLFQQTGGRGFGDKPAWDITLVGHSMGAIVINEVLTTYPDLPVKNIVFMAPACSVRDAEKVVVPYLKRHRATRFFLLTLHPTAEAEEKFSILPWYDLVPRGSLLEWIDSWYTTPPSYADRTLGKWLNIIPAIHVFADVRDRVYIKSFDVLGGETPERHGDFNDFAFWQPSFWWDASLTR